MTRTLLGCLLVGLALVAGGCRMCAGPYDYCGPLCDGSCGGTCDLNQPRAGEITVITEPHLLEPILAEPRVVEDVPFSIEEPTPAVSPPISTDHLLENVAPSSRPDWTAQRPTESQVQ